jgi:hypothetical protein
MRSLPRGHRTEEESSLPGIAWQAGIRWEVFRHLVGEGDEGAAPGEGVEAQANVMRVPPQGDRQVTPGKGDKGVATGESNGRPGPSPRQGDGR